ncbi:hypothetical protein I552_3235 [Mycobacterium xenopi 3993]|nr:hypothetical protein I552_3235 [Mycobacterium xenopi 3993]
MTDFELDSLILLKRAEARSLDFRVVDEHVGRTVLGAMKPNPFSALNHFTVPCGISRSFLLFWVRCTVFRCPGLL